MSTKVARANYYAKRRKMVDEFLGTRCRICGSSRMLRVHRRDGHSHPKILNMSNEEALRELSSGAYARLCQICHSSIHWYMRNQESIDKFITER